MKYFNQNLKNFLKVIVLPVSIMFFFSSGIFSAKNPVDYDFSDNVSTVLDISISIVIFFGFFILINKILKMPEEESGIKKLKKTEFSKLLINSLILCITLFVIDFTIQIIMSYIPILSNIRSPEDELQIIWPHFPGIFLICLSMIGTGYSEEIIFRSLFLAGCTKVYGKLFATIFTSVIFALMHFFQGWTNMIIILFDSIFLSIVFLKTRNLHYVAWIHAYYDIIGVLIIYFFKSSSFTL